MRVISAPELTLLQGKTFKTDQKLEVENVDGTWVDLSDRLIAADITDDVDQKTVTVVFTLARDSGDANTASLSPMMSGSTLNVDDSDVYAPLITAGRKFRFSVCCVALTATFASGTYHELVTGRFDKPSFAATQMTVEARDLGGLLIDTIAIADTTYGDADDPGDALGVGQQYLDDNVGDDAPTLVDESGTDFVVTTFRQVNVPVMEGLNQLATKAGGLVVRYKYDADGVSQLTMFDPLRENTTPAVTLTPSRYIEIPLAAIDATNVRNIIRGEFIDPVTGELQTLEVRDTDSIAAFGPRFMQLGADLFEGLTGNQVLDVLNAALADLALPKFDHEVTRLGFWPVAIGDVIEWAPNGTTYDETQTLAVVGYTHRFEKGTFRTTFRCRGKPAGSYADWIRRQGTGPTGPLLPPTPDFAEPFGESHTYGRTDLDGTLILRYGFKSGVDEIRMHATRGSGAALPVPDISATSYAFTIRRPEGDIGDDPNYSSIAVISTLENYYKRLTGVGVRGGLTSPQWNSGVVQAIDPIPAIVRGTVATLAVSADVDAGTNTVTVTPSALDPDADSWVVIVRNEHELPPIHIGTSLTPVVFPDSGLDLGPQKAWLYDAFILTTREDDGVLSGVTGQRFRTIVDTPTTVAPEFAENTPVGAVVGGAQRVQISWVCTTPTATTVLVEASLDRVSVRAVGTGAAASGTIYDTNTDIKSYRLVALSALGVRIAMSEWRLYTRAQGPLSNPNAVPTFVKGTPKTWLVIRSGFTGMQLWISWTCATPGARVISIKRSADNGVSDPFTEVARVGDVAAGDWYSDDRTADYYYRLDALGATSDTPLASSIVVHYVP